MRRLNAMISRVFRAKRKFGPPGLVLITTGRKTGRLHQTPLQYELLDGSYYVGSARGIDADWYRNILANPEVKFILEGMEYSAFAEAITDPERIADFLELRLERNPFMIGLIIRLEGLPRGFSRAQLLEFASEKAIVVLNPHSAG
jgi:deazaflavin-dependent oxidoreductase (nitroreductase family)